MAKHDDYPPMCCVCGLPDSACTLVRITFVHDGKGRPMTDGYWDEEWMMMSPAVAKQPKANDSLVCEDCIRGIKRIPFTDLPLGRLNPESA